MPSSAIGGGGGWINSRGKRACLRGFASLSLTLSFSLPPPPSPFMCIRMYESLMVCASINSVGQLV